MSALNSFKGAVAAGLVGLGAAAPQAEADLIRIETVMDITSSSTGTQGLGFDVGDDIFMTFLIDTSLPDSNPSSTIWFSADAIVDASFSSEGYSFDAQNGGVSLVSVFDRFSLNQGGADFYNLSPNWNDVSILSTASLFDDGDPFTSDDPSQITLENLSQFNIQQFTLNTSVGSLSANVTDLDVYVVPTPGSFALGAVGLAGLAVARGRRRGPETAVAPSGPSAEL